jgi:hypothetical protein
MQDHDMEFQPNNTEGSAPITETHPAAVDFSTSRSGRRNRFPTKRYEDFLPVKARGLPHFARVPPPPPNFILREPTPAPAPDPEVTDSRPKPIRTEPNEFGLFRVYPAMPSSNPDDMISLDNLCDSPNLAVAPQANRTPSSPFGLSSVANAAGEIFAPFLNMTVFRLMNWFYSGSQMKSLAELDRLVNEVILQEDFDTAHLVGFRAVAENLRLDAHQATKNRDGTFSSAEGWTETCIKLRLPAEKAKFAKEEDAPLFDVPGLFHRDIIAITKSVYQSDTFYEMNTMPYKEYVQTSPETPPDRVWGEAYTADAHYHFHEEVQTVPRADGRRCYGARYRRHPDMVRLNPLGQFR